MERAGVDFKWLQAHLRTAGEPREKSADAAYSELPEMGTAGHSQGTVTKVTRGLGLDQTEMNFLRDGGWRAGGTERPPLSGGVGHRGDK